MAELIAENLTHLCPQTNLYRLSGGQHVLVTVPDTERLDDIPFIPGMPGAVKFETPPTPTDVFLADEYGRPVDADGDPTNGLTALLRLAGGTGFDVACQKAEELLG